MKFNKKNRKQKADLNYLARRSILKCTKIAKLFLLQKAIRQCKKSRISGDSVVTESALQRITSLKSTCHTLVGDHALKMALGDDLKLDSLDVGQKEGIGMILKQKNLTEAISYWRERLAIAKKAEKDSSDTRTEKQTIKKQNLTNGSRAVFLESLDEVRTVGNTNRSQKSGNQKRVSKPVILSHYMRQPEQVGSQLKDVETTGQSVDRATTSILSHHKTQKIFNTTIAGGKTLPIFNASDPEAPPVRTFKTVSSNRTSTKTTATSLQEAVAVGKNWRENGVHPSWAAKQALKAKTPILEIGFQGKKTKFEDSDV